MRVLEEYGREYWRQVESGWRYFIFIEKHIQCVFYHNEKFPVKMN